MTNCLFAIIQHMFWLKKRTNVTSRDDHIPVSPQIMTRDDEKEAQDCEERRRETAVIIFNNKLILEEIVHPKSTLVRVILPEHREINTPLPECPICFEKMNTADCVSLRSCSTPLVKDQYFGNKVHGFHYKCLYSFSK